MTRVPLLHLKRLLWCCKTRLVSGLRKEREMGKVWGRGVGWHMSGQAEPRSAGERESKRP